MSGLTKASNVAASHSQVPSHGRSSPQGFFLDSTCCRLAVEAIEMLAGDGAQDPSDGRPSPQAFFGISASEEAIRIFGAASLDPHSQSVQHWPSAQAFL